MRWAPDLFPADALSDSAKAIWEVLAEARSDVEAGVSASPAIVEFDLPLLAQAAEELEVLWGGDPA